MHPLWFIIPTALAIALAVWGAWQWAFGDATARRRKLTERLNLETGAATDLTEFRSVRVQSDISGLNAMLIRWPGFAALQRSLLWSYPDVSLARFLSIVLGLGLLGFLLFWVWMDAVVVALGGGAVAGYLPFLALTARRNRRQCQLSAQVPEAMDFLSRVLRAGHSLTTGLQMLGDELPAPLSTEFRRCYDQHSLGHPMEECLKDMSARIDSSDFTFFVTAVLIQRQTGGDLSEVLNNISDMIRQRIRLQQHVKARTAEGRLTGYVLLAFPMVMFLVVNALSPRYAKELTQTALGIKLLVFAFTLQALGLFFIRRITTVRV